MRMTVSGSDAWKVVEGLKPAMLMVTVQLTFAVMNVLYKLAVYDGMNLRVLIAYRFIFATAFMAPLALLLERKKRSKMTWTILFQASLCGLFGGVLAQSLYLETLALTSATFASAMSNLNPAVTFLLALCFGMERLNLRRAAGKAKVIGTLTGIGGAMLLTFFKGTQIDTPSFHVNLLRHHSGHVASSHASSNGSTVLGALSALGSSLCFGLWLIVQGKMSVKYSSHYSSTCLMSLTASVMAVALALSVDRDWSQWRFGWNIRLLTVAFAGMVPSGLTVVMIAWCVQRRGPLFVSVFSPVLLLILAVVGSFSLDEKLHLGSIIGGVLIVCGLYVVLWGKAEEMKMNLVVVVPSRTLHVSPTVEIIVKSPLEDAKINHVINNINTSNDVGDHGDNSSQNESEADNHGKKENVIISGNPSGP